MLDQGPDSVDRLFARLERVDPPPDFMARLTARLDVEPPGTVRPVSLLGLVYAAAYVLALLALGGLSYRLGTSLAHNGGSVLITTLAGHRELVAEAPDTYLGALAASVPVFEAVATCLDLVLLSLMTSLLLRSLRPAGRVLGRNDRAAPGR